MPALPGRLKHLPVKMQSIRIKNAQCAIRIIGQNLREYSFQKNYAAVSVPYSSIATTIGNPLQGRYPLFV